MTGPRNEAFEELSDDILKARSAGAVKGMDDKELKEREDAAKKYAGESEKHFVDYYMDCKKTSVDANIDIRKDQDELYKMYLEDEPEFYGQKESWQARTVVPKPFQTVQFGSASVKKAFTPEFLTIKDEINKDSAKFWQDVMTIELNDQNADFITRFGDATTMALAIGDSMEMIPQYTPGVGLRFDLIEPWKIHRDPDALARDPQSGLYWIHEEWIDYFILQKGQENSKYFDVARCKNITEGDSVANDDLTTKDAIAKRKRQIWKKSDFRSMVLTGEFWGSILSPKGELLLDQGTYTVAGYRVIETPKNSPYETLRWPGISFSVMPDLLRFGGRGLLESVKSIWESMNILMCLAEDNYKWAVNPPSEINVDLLVDPTDVQNWPGKEYLVNSSIHGHQAVRTVDRKDVTNSVLANMQYYDQNFQRGSFVNDSVQGLPGWRKDITAKESSQNLGQSLGVFSLMGSNIEHGAIWILTAAREAMKTFAGYDDYVRVLGRQKVDDLEMVPGEEEGGSGNVINNLPVPSGSMHISGIQALMKEQETLAVLKEIIIPLAGQPRFAPYIAPYATLKAIESRTNIEDENIIVDKDQASEINNAEMEEMKKAEHIKQRFTQLEAMERHSKIEETYAKIENMEEKLKIGFEELKIQKDEFALEVVKAEADIVSNKEE